LTFDEKIVLGRTGLKVSGLGIASGYWAPPKTNSKKHLTLFLALIFASLRIGQAIGLEWGDIDWRKQELVIRRTYDRDYNKLRPPKNDKIRRVPKGI
jgi:integrase